jgi:hypothetical protein
MDHAVDMIGDYMGCRIFELLKLEDLWLRYGLLFFSLQSRQHTYVGNSISGLLKSSAMKIQRTGKSGPD